MLHRRFKSELESGVDWSRKSWPSAGETFGRSGSPGAVPLLLCLLVWGFKASETTSRSRLEDAFQEVYMEGSFTGLTCRRVLCRRNIQTQETIRHGTVTLPSKVQFSPLQYPLRSHMSDLHLFNFSQAYVHLLDQACLPLAEAQTQCRPPLLYCHPLVVA